ncbi:MAG TPA: hypothetical protein VE086_00980 [Chthoniobacterales bacterium]|nr:hypothetical protein [Chthoniobacterales bacterium]
MLTAAEVEDRARKRRRLLIIGGSIAALMVIVAFAAKPSMRAIKGFQARRHATRAFELMEKEKWSEARSEALAAYQLRPSEPEALRAVARYLTRTRQQQALDFWKNLRAVSQLSREDLRDEATIAMLSGEAERATQAVNDLLANNGREAIPRDWLIAAQLAAQKGATAEAIRDLQKIFENKTATEREQLQAALLELQVSNSGDAETDRRTQADAWSRVVTLSEGKTETALDALIILARRALATRGGTSSVSSAADSDATADVPPTTTPLPMEVPKLIAAIEHHPLAKAPHKLIALDLQMHENPSEKEACIARAIEEWKGSDAASLTALAAWLNGHGEFQRELDTIPLEKSLADRDLFLQHLDALGALGRWDDIRKLLEAERFPIDSVIQRMYLARTNAQLGQKAAAENNWQRALESAGNDLGKLMTLANYAEKNDAMEIAGAAYEAAAAIAPKLRAVQQGRLRLAQAGRDTKKIHAILAEMLAIWPNDTAIQNDEAYTRLLLLGGTASVPSTSNRDDTEVVPPEELITIEQLAEKLVQREPTSLPHRTLLALARLKQHRPVAALDAYANVQAAPNSLTPSALAVHAAVLFANGQRDDALKEIAQVPIDRLLPEEQAGTADLRPVPEPSPTP